MIYVHLNVNVTSCPNLSVSLYFFKLSSNSRTVLISVFYLSLHWLYMFKMLALTLKPAKSVIKNKKMGDQDRQPA